MHITLRKHLQKLLPGLPAPVDCPCLGILTLHCGRAPPPVSILASKAEKVLSIIEPQLQKIQIQPLLDDLQGELFS